MELRTLDRVFEITVIDTVTQVEPIQVHPTRMQLFRPDVIRIVWFRQGNEKYTAISITVSGPEVRKGPGSMAKMERNFWTEELPEWLRKARDDMTPEEVKVHNATQDGDAPDES